MPAHDATPKQPSARTVTDPRDGAYRHLSRQAERMPDLGLSDLNTGALDIRDASLSHAIVDAVITRWITLDYIISSLGGRPLRDQEPRMQAVLLGGAAQLLLMDRIPPHAAIDESVEWAKDRIRPGAGGMVNAILRKVARARGEKLGKWDHHLDAIPLPGGSRLSLKGVELPGSGRSRLSIACSIAPQLVQRWENQFGDPTPQAMHTLFKAPTLMYVGRASAEIEGLELSPHESEKHRVYEGQRAPLVELLALRDDIWIQDPASSSVVDEIELDADPGLIVDLCAGQGTKTRQLRARFPRSRIIASEIDEARLATLAQVFGHGGAVETMHVDELMTRAGLNADLVLIDVPCSNTGVLARRREARYRPMKKQLARLIPIQRQIARGACSLLGSEGTLVYSTCSAETEENERQADWIVSELGLSLTRSHRILPQGQPGDPDSRYHDGSYSAQLKR